MISSAMDTDSIPILLAIVLLIVFSAFFSATETAFSSLNRLKLKGMAASGDRKAAKTLAISEKYDKLLTTILIGNNIVNITMSSLATVFFLGIFVKNGAAISTVVITILVLIFGEITPKSLAKEAPERFAMAVTPVIRGFLFLFTPVNYIFTKWKKLLLKLFRVHGEKAVTEEDILTIVDEAESVGELDAGESRIIRSAIEFKEMEVREILTPRVRMTAVDRTLPPEEILAVFRESEYTRIPVYEETADRIVGILNQKDFYERVLISGEPLEGVWSKPTFVPESVKLGDLLQEMRRSHIHMAVVVDEYGGTAGIVTMEDILEELVGEIYDEHDEEEIELRRTHGGYRALCSAPVSDLFDAVGYEEETDSATVSGWLMEKLERIPVRGDHFTAGPLTVTVTKARKNQPLEVYVKVEKPQDGEKEARSGETV